LQCEAFCASSRHMHHLPRLQEAVFFAALLCFMGGAVQTRAMLTDQQPSAHAAASIARGASDLKAQMARAGRMESPDDLAFYIVN